MLKTIDHIFEVAPQNKLWTMIDEAGHSRPYELNDWRNSISDIELTDHVPGSVRMYFDAAKNVLLYSWFSYEMMPAAELFSYAILEKALRIRFKQEKNKKIMLCGLLREALRMGLINDAGFHVPRNWVQQNMYFDGHDLVVESSRKTLEELRACTEYSNMLCDSIATVRNLYAHGDAGLHPHAMLTLKIHSELINMLFAAETCLNSKGK